MFYVFVTIEWEREGKRRDEGQVKVGDSWSAS